MSVMEQMRSGSDSTFMQVVMALVVVSFVFWYATPQGDKTSVVASVNGTRIMDTDFRRAYRDMERQREGRFGRALSEPEKKQLSSDVKTQMVENEVLLQQAHKLGLEVSDTEVAKQLLDIDIFRNESGVFDVDLYKRYLKRTGYTRADFEERLREDLLRAKLRQLVFVGASISEPVMKQAYIEQNTKVNVTYVRVRSSQFYDEVEVSDVDLQSWQSENPDKAKEIYERDYDRLYNHPAELHLRTIRLAILQDGEGAAKLLPRLRGIKEQAEAGVDFVELAKKWSEDPSASTGGDLGTRSLRQLSSEVQDAVSHLGVGEVSKIVTNDKEVRIFRVDARKEAYVQPFEDVKLKIVEQAVREARSPELATRFVEEVLIPKWKESGEVPNDLLRPRGILAIPTGLVPAHSKGGPFDPPQDLFDDARDAEPGTVLDDIYETNGVLFAGQLTAREAADMDEFDTNRDKIRDQVLFQRRIAFFQGWVADAKAQAKIEM